MGVAGEVTEYLLRPGQRRLGVDHPLRLLHGREELAPGWWRTPALALSLQAEAVLGGGLPQRREKRPPEKPAEDADREKEAFGARDPGGAIQRQPSRWH